MARRRLCFNLKKDPHFTCPRMISNIQKKLATKTGSDINPIAKSFPWFPSACNAIRKPPTKSISTRINIQIKTANAAVQTKVRILMCPVLASTATKVTSRSKVINVNAIPKVTKNPHAVTGVNITHSDSEPLTRE